MSVTKVVLGKLSPTMEEGAIVRWARQEGDPVKVGDVLAEIETDKANMEMEALGKGILRKILVPAGGKAPVGALIGVIAEADDDIEPLLAEARNAAAPTPEASPAEPTPEAPPTTTPEPATPAPAPAPVARPPAEAPAVRGPASPATEPASGRLKASPLARAMAARENIPLSSIPGSGPGGRIIKRDIDAYRSGDVVVPVTADRAPSQAGPGPAPAPTAAKPGVRPGEKIAHTGMRRTIARRLAESKFTAPHFYVSMEIDMAAAAALREDLARAGEVKPSYNDLVVKACGKALRRQPMVNASWLDDHIAVHTSVHVGVAVALPDGLITPVVRDVDVKPVGTIATEIRDLAARARARKLKPEDYSGSTFTVSNLGMLDVASFTAIINPPEAAILAVGAVRKVPVVVEDRIEPGLRMTVTMSSDHRVVDGALAAQFLQEVRRLLENPLALFV